MKKLRKEDYTVGWICALPNPEWKASRLLLDETHEVVRLGLAARQQYVYGSMNGHNVVMGCLPATQLGSASAAAVASEMGSTFPCLRLGLMVGVGGGVPSETKDVRLGDVVVSQPDTTAQHGGVIQYDVGRALQGGIFQHTGQLNQPPEILLSALGKVQATPRRESRFDAYLNSDSFEDEPEFADRPRADRLFKADYPHVGGQATCDECESEHEIPRPPRKREGPVVHYGTIASGNQVMKDAATRDRISKEFHGVLCFEMEAAGLMNRFPCLVVRGICDYCDSHKHKAWQPFAAAAAAAWAKELLRNIAPADVCGGATVGELMNEDADSYDVPFSLKGVPVTASFVGRNAQLDRIDESLQPSSNDRKRRSMFIVCGLGGVGKTQLVVEYARKHQHSYSGVFWLDGASRDRLRQSFLQVARRLPHEQLRSHIVAMLGAPAVDAEAVLEEVLRWLSIPANKRWLLVIDNVDLEYEGPSKDEQGYDPRGIIPDADHGSVLITTRLAGVERLGDSLRLGHVNDDEAKAILQSSAKKPLQDVDVLLRKLNGLPLALTQAGAYIGRTGIDVSTYIRHFDGTWSDLIRKQDRFPLQEYAQRSMLTTWKISYEQVLRQSKAAASLLKLWAFFSPDDVWYGLIASALEIGDEVDTPAWLTDLAADDLEFADAVGLLTTYSLVEGKAENAGYTMHSVLHKWCELLCVEEGDGPLFQVLCACMLGVSVPSSVGKSEYWKMDRRLLPHIMHMWSKREKAEVPAWMEIPAWALHSMAEPFHRQGKLREAKLMYEQALVGMENALGPDRTSTLGTVNNLGILYRSQGKLDEAEKMYKRALAGYENALGPEHTSTLLTVNNMGNLYRDQGKLDEAEKMYKRALAGYEN
ncbi:hypothetical protein LTR56_026445, partial [Elasticomyces elasticus]